MFVHNVPDPKFPPEWPLELPEPLDADDREDELHSQGDLQLYGLL